MRIWLPGCKTGALVYATAMLRNRIGAAVTAPLTLVAQRPDGLEVGRITVAGDKLAALHGLLRRVRDLGLPLLSVIQVEPKQADGSDGNADTDHDRSNKERNT